MNAKLNPEIAEFLSRHDRPVEVQDPSGNTYFIMTDEQFKKYVYDDSELSVEEMLAAATSQIEDPEGWGSPGMDDYDQDDDHPTS